MKTEFPDKYITLGLKIAYYRRKAGFTQEYFAELIGKSVSFVGQNPLRLLLFSIISKRFLIS